RGREEEKDETSPDDEHGPAQRRLHGTHAHTLWSGHLHHATLVSLPPLHTPLFWHATSLAAGLGRLVTLLCTLGVHGAGRAGQHQQEEAHPDDGVCCRFHSRPPWHQTMSRSQC